jgi:hypothetical protein
VNHQIALIQYTSQFTLIVSAVKIAYLTAPISLKMETQSLNNLGSPIASSSPKKGGKYKIKRNINSLRVLTVNFQSARSKNHVNQLVKGSCRWCKTTLLYWIENRTNTMSPSSSVYCFYACFKYTLVQLFLVSIKDLNLILSRQARFYATTEQKLINSFWNALRIRRKINQLYQTKFVLYIVYNSIYYTTQNNPLICWLSGTSENWRRTSRSCVTVVRRDKWKNQIPKRAGTTDISISTGIKYWVFCIKEPCLTSNLSIIFLIKTKVKRQIKTLLFYHLSFFQTCFDEVQGHWQN